MADIKLNSDSNDVGTKFKIIGISVTLGLNAMTISELTGIPRASVIRKLNDLMKVQYIIQNNQNLYTTCTPKKGSAGFSKLTKFFVSNQPNIRETIRDFLNYTIF